MFTTHFFAYLPITLLVLTVILFSNMKNCAVWTQELLKYTTLASGT